MLLVLLLYDTELNIAVQTKQAILSSHLKRNLTFCGPSSSPVKVLPLKFFG